MKAFCNKKKALAFVCVLVLAMLVIPFAALPVQAARNVNAGNCYQVDPQKPIIVDGKMDEAYRYGFCAVIDSYMISQPGLYTYGVAYFAWSGSSIYCYVIVNDADIAQPAAYWAADCVELYLHRGDDIKRDYPITSNSALNGTNMPIVPAGQNHAGSQRARQYRIDGAVGTPTCYLFGEGLTYEWNEKKGRLYNEDGAMITEKLNAFGWYEGGWANNIFKTGSSGYAVEYKIDFETPLKAGEKFRFDLMISDRFGNPYARDQVNIYYNSAVRQEKGTVISNINEYDHFTLSGSIVSNKSIIADEDLYIYGRSDTTTEKEDPSCRNHAAGVRGWMSANATQHEGYCVTCNQKIYAAHVAKAVVTKQPTCKEAGQREYYCKDCSVFLRSEKIPALATHKWDEGEITEPASCTDAGTKTYTCTTCRATKTENVEALGHDEISHEPKAPTCTDVGWDAYVTCSRCDYTTYVEKAALDHDKIAHEAKEPSCTEIGWDAYETCSRCNYTTYQEKPAADHAWDSGTVTVQQTCTTPLVVTYSCENCEEERVSTLNNGALLPHSYTEEIVAEKYLKSPATETESAVYYKSCACGETGTETFTYGDPLPSKSGCGGSLHGTEIVLLGLALVTALYTCKARKRREN